MKHVKQAGAWNADPARSTLPEVGEIRWVGSVVQNYICHEVRDKSPMKKTKKKFKVMLKIVSISSCNSSLYSYMTFYGS